ncbi:CHAT domain-containing protein [Anabaena lutea]|uniref:CHAT domain-containing protein n=1 Tax=Anabaena lutea FACHB-196 TaxID=2692881 RepID=A0ABR8FDC6_9NOST|nr:CHAT domain-containing protein [Anabaena lutea]MBD2567623.1 CHAT domain-containing protein [Anabaena lutea FACHB-196]
MKFNRLFLSIFLSVILILSFLKSVQAQSENQSDITNPDPQEVVNPGNQSDITNPDPQEVVNPNNDNKDTGVIVVDRNEFDRAFSAATPAEAVTQLEELQAFQFGAYLGTDFFGDITSAEGIANNLAILTKKTNRKAAVIYVTALKDKLSLILIPPIEDQKNISSNYKSLQVTTPIPVYQPQILRKDIQEAKNSNIQKVAKEFRAKITNNRRNDYFTSAQQLYNWIIEPLEPALKANKINTLIFSLDSGLRTIPIAALHDGKEFLIEKYSIGIIPSFSLTDTRYVPIVNSDILAMGISQSTEGQEPLPSVPIEIDAISKQIWQSQAQVFLNEASTLNNLKAFSNKQNYGIIHLATHGDFKPGKINNSYIQLWNEKINLQQLRKLSQELQWSKNPKVEMLVLSACRTALGSQEVELGFSGLAVQAGVKSVLGSLWYVSDQGSLALMTKFYEQLKMTSLRSESLRQAQLAMLKGEVRIADEQLYLSPEKRISLPPELSNLGKIDLSHPYFWSAFTMIGNWN